MSKAVKRERQKENRERARIERERIQKREKQVKTFRSLLIVLVPIMAILIVVSLTSGGDDAKASIDPNKGYTATIDTSEGTMVLALDAKNNPKVTESFVNFADAKKYDGLCIDRVARDFVIQGGSPSCDRQGDLGATVVGTVPTDHYPVGTLAAAKSPSDPPGTFGGQFFIVTGAQGETTPNDYARFGTVVSGQDVAQKIANLPIQGNTQDGPPAQKVTIKQIRIKVTKSPVTSSTTSAATSSTTAAPTSSTTSG